MSEEANSDTYVSASVEERIWSSDSLVVVEESPGKYKLDIREEFKCPGCHDAKLWSVLDGLGFPDDYNYIFTHTNCDACPPFEPPDVADAPAIASSDEATSVNKRVTACFSLSR